MLLYSPKHNKTQKIPNLCFIYLVIQILHRFLIQDAIGVFDIPTVTNTTPSTTTSAFSSCSPTHTSPFFPTSSSTHIIFLVAVPSPFPSAVVHSTDKISFTGSIRVTVSLSSCTFYNICRPATFSACIEAIWVIQTSSALRFAMSHYNLKQ